MRIRVKNLIVTVRILVIAVLVLNWTSVFADTTNFVEIGGTKAGKIKTIFPEDGKLTKQEIVQVIELAKQIGLTNAAEISIFHFLPGGGKGVTVKSAESHNGRTTSFEYVHIYKVGWASMETNSNTKLLGAFWSDADNRISTLIRDYKSADGKMFQVYIGKGVDIAIADKMVGLIIADKLPFTEKQKEGEMVFTFPEKPKNLKPESIYTGDSKNTYKVEFKTQIVFIYKYEKGEFIYTGGYSYNI